MKSDIIFSGLAAKGLRAELLASSHASRLHLDLEGCGKTSGVEQGLQPYNQPLSHESRTSPSGALISTLSAACENLRSKGVHLSGRRWEHPISVSIFCTPRFLRCHESFAVA